MSKFQALLCDDVRVEDSGKYIVIGAYTGSVSVKAFPLLGEFSLFLVISEVNPGEAVLKIALTKTNEELSGLIKTFPLEVSEDGRATLIFQGVEINATEPTFVNIHCAIGEEDLRIVERIPIRSLST